MTGSYEFCMLIDGLVKRYPTAVVELATPYYTGIANVYRVHVDLSQKLKSDRYMQQKKQVSTTQGQQVNQPEHTLQTGQEQVDANGQSSQTEATGTCAAS